MMKVKHLEIGNFRAIKHTKFDFHPRLNIFAGENGVGKSTVLNCLAILLSRMTWRIVSSKSSGRLFTEDDISHGQKETSSSIQIFVDGKGYQWRAGKSISRTKNPSITNLNSIKEIVNTVNNNLDDNNQCSIPLAVLYSTNRAVLEVPLRIRKQHTFDQIAALEDSLLGKRNEGDFKLFFEWFRNREDLENEHFRIAMEAKGLAAVYATEFQDPQLSAVRTAIQSFLPQFNNLKVRRKPRLSMVLEKSSEVLRIEELSDGEKCLLALVADMARRIAMANPGMQNPLEGEAVFLIDEVELHLHPSWQRTVIPKLLETFPNSQFFITTHSPQVLGEIEDTSSIWVMKNGEQPVHPSRAYGLDSNEILSELMGASDRSAPVQELLDEIDMLINDDKFDDARAKIRALAQKTKDIPALHGANAMLTMLGEEQVELVED